MKSIKLLVQVSQKGGAGSGNWGHTGRPGAVGGSGGSGTFSGVVSGFENVDIPEDYKRIGNKYRTEFDLAGAESSASISSGETLQGVRKYILDIQVTPILGGKTQRRSRSMNTAREAFDLVDKVKTFKLNFNDV